MLRNLTLCALLLSRTVFATDAAPIAHLEKDGLPQVKVRSCSELYGDGHIRKASDVLLKKGAMFGLGVGALVCSIVGTVLTAGIAGPVAIPGGIAACAIAGGKAVFDGIELEDPVRNFFNDRRVAKILSQARGLVSNPKTTDIEDIKEFYNKQYSGSGNATRVENVPSLEAVAQLLIRQDNAQNICKVKDLGPAEGTFMTFLMEDEIPLL